MTTRREFLSDISHRIRFVYLPKHSSWLNQIEIFLGIVQRKCLRGGNFTAAPDHDVRFQLHDVQFVPDATVSGTGLWRLSDGRVHGDLVVKRPGFADVQVKVDWNQRVGTALATVGGASLTLPAP